ncbi:tegument protein UL21 [Testudinid alphaherpesvirus 3]|uniref:Tegument protein UL21 n=1 Tax=Testudinid alphaherpesvirus 3 TaxID=2560801 RepID=A0A0M3MZ41_9ALPH|nr:tegument protein UL21 [Testudinid alphaherpesvirus 3]AKI81660.1 tegument protein UL21 [Testudinid alphaherpesvirus 3]AKI81763.1 tegument protein UL21 [Testudinid alphaherpesvirus 3]
MNVGYTKAYTIHGSTCYEDTNVGKCYFWSGGCLFGINLRTGQMTKYGHELLDRSLAYYIRADLKKYGSDRLESPGPLYFDDLVSATNQGATEKALINNTGALLGNAFSVYHYTLVGQSGLQGLVITTGSVEQSRLTLLEHPKIQHPTTSFEYVSPSKLFRVSEIKLLSVPVSLRSIWKSIMKSETIPDFPPSNKNRVTINDAVYVKSISPRPEVWGTGGADSDISELYATFCVLDGHELTCSLSRTQRAGLAQITEAAKILFKNPFLIRENTNRPLHLLQKMLLLQILFARHGMLNCYEFLVRISEGQTPMSNPPTVAEVADRANEIFQSALIFMYVLEAIIETEFPQGYQISEISPYVRETEHLFSTIRAMAEPDQLVIKISLVSSLIHMLYTGESPRRIVDFFRTKLPSGRFIHNVLGVGSRSVFTETEEDATQLVYHLATNRIKIRS